MKFFKSTISLLILLILPIFIIGCNNEEDQGPIPLDTRYTDELKLEASTLEKDFITDGIGEVTLSRSVDGDTISVNTGSRNVTIRFLGIDTPESTGKVEAWGKKASDFVKEKLENAYSIVLVAEGERVDSTGNRYLAWVWYQPAAGADYRLINLEEIELAYTQYMTNKDFENHETLWAASEKAKKSQKRIWGEKDPDFNYSNESIKTSILYILDNHDEFQTGTIFQITVRLIRTVGNNMFLEDANDVTYEDGGEVKTGKGHIYAFYGYTANYYRYYDIGDVFTLECQLDYDGQYGIQLTGLRNPGRAMDNEIPKLLRLNANELDGGKDLVLYYGQVVTVENLKCISIYTRETENSKETYYIAKFINDNSDKFDVYFGNSLISKHNVEEILTVGKVYNITGGIAYFESASGSYQISVGDAPRYSKGELDERDLPRLNDIVEVDN